MRCNHGTHWLTRVVFPSKRTPNGEPYKDGGCPFTGMSTSAITGR